MLSALLRQKGIPAEAAVNGVEALEKLSEDHFGLVLLDLMMPEMDGEHFLRELANVTRRSAPVVLVVTGAPQETVERLDHRTIHGVIRKPFDPEEMADLVRNCIDVRRSRGIDTMSFAGLVVATHLFAYLSTRF